MRIEEDGFYISVTDLISFRACRRRWLFENALHYRTKRIPIHLLAGSMIHEGLALYYQTNDAELVIAEYNKLLPEEEDMLEAFTMTRDILTHYMVYDTMHPLRGEVLGTEYVATPIEITTYKGLPVYLGGRYDLVLKTDRGIHIVDHKLKLNSPPKDLISLDDQLTGYAYLWYKASGELPHAITYNILLRKLPQKPKILLSGDLSQDKTQNVSYHTYTEAITELGLPPEKYREHLNYLLSQGWERFFLRISISKTLNEILSYENRITQEIPVMLEALDRREKCTPNPNVYQCMGCPMLDVCRTMEQMGDYQALVAALYVKDERVYDVI